MGPGGRRLTARVRSREPWCSGIRRVRGPATRTCDRADTHLPVGRGLSGYRLVLPVPAQIPEGTEGLDSLPQRKPDRLVGVQPYRRSSSTTADRIAIAAVG